MIAASAGAVALALSDRGDPTAGTMPPDGDGPALVAKLVPALRDPVAIARLVPADTADERESITRFCSEPAGAEPSVTIDDAVIATPFAGLVQAVSAPGETADQCALWFRWSQDEGWHVSAKQSRER